MKILLTGASSFTGFWFVRELARAGHHVVVPLRAAESDYSGIRRERVARLVEYAEIVWSSAFGEAAFLNLAKRGGFDILCHHAARVADYRSPDFDVAAALVENTRSLRSVLLTLRDGGLKAMVLTGSVFEAEEGAGSMPMRAFSPYGVSKGLTAALVRYWCDELGIPLGKFVIANPFGPYEEPRFCTYLIKTWKRRQAAEVRTPAYVRDNIHVDLLAMAYLRFTTTMAEGSGFAKYNPSGYVETQGAFARRFADEIGPRLGLAAEVKLAIQTDYSEPLVRINTEPMDATRLGWQEAAAWDAIADYYR